MLIAGIILIGGAVLASIFGQTTFLTDIVNSPFVTLITLERYIYDFFNWLGLAPLGIFFAIIVEFFIAYFVIQLFIMLVNIIKSLINVFGKRK